MGQPFLANFAFMHAMGLLLFDALQLQCIAVIVTYSIARLTGNEVVNGHGKEDRSIMSSCQF